MRFVDIVPVFVELLGVFTFSVLMTCWWCPKSAVIVAQLLTRRAAALSAARDEYQRVWGYESPCEFGGKHTQRQCTCDPLGIETPTGF